MQTENPNRHYLYVCKGIDNPDHFYHYRYHRIVDRIAFTVFYIFAVVGFSSVFSAPYALAAVFVFLLFALMVSVPIIISILLNALVRFYTGKDELL